MAGGVDKRTRNLLVLLAVLLAAAAYTYRDFLIPGGSSQSEEIESGEIPLGEQLAALEELPGIPLDRPYSAEDYAAQRNLFDFTKSPEQIAAEKARREERRRQAERQREKQKEERERRQARKQEIQRQKQQQQQRDRVPPPPDFKYTYVAYMSHLQGEEGAMAVLVKGSGPRDPKKENIRIVTNGEIVDDDFVIKEIDLDKLVIGYTDDRYDGKTRSVELIPPREGRGGGRPTRGRRRR